jgi:hypothetical protein
MNIDKIIKNVTDNVIKETAQQQPDNNILYCPVDTLKIVLAGVDLNDIDIQSLILQRWRVDILDYIDNYLVSCPDPHANEGMYKCSLETWKACACRIGLDYFLKYKLVRDYNREAREGGLRFNDGLIELGLTLYEQFCNDYRKQFFIYDSCKFLGMNLDSMYTLNDIHARYIKKAHSVQEDSMRSALASGRSNVTAMAILLNHDYDYTRTTQVIHTSGRDNLRADDLPKLEQTQDIVIDSLQQLPQNNDNAL